MLRERERDDGGHDSVGNDTWVCDTCRVVEVGKAMDTVCTRWYGSKPFSGKNIKSFSSLTFCVAVCWAQLPAAYWDGLKGQFSYVMSLITCTTLTRLVKSSYICGIIKLRVYRPSPETIYSLIT